MIAGWRQRARQLKRETYALYLAYRDPRVPWYAKLLAACVVAYAFSPIDLIPDFIPVLGYADDAILISLVLRSVIRRAGSQTVERHWPGTPDGLRAIRLLTGLDRAAA